MRFTNIFANAVSRPRFARGGEDLPVWAEQADAHYAGVGRDDTLHAVDQFGTVRHSVCQCGSCRDPRHFLEICQLGVPEIIVGGKHDNKLGHTIAANTTRNTRRASRKRSIRRSAVIQCIEELGDDFKPAILWLSALFPIALKLNDNI